MNNNSGTLNKILNGINNTLNIANKAIPIYNQSKPIINTAKETYKTIKNSSSDISKMIKLMKVKNQIKKDMNNKEPIMPNTTYSNINNPKFFI